MHFVSLVLLSQAVVTSYFFDKLLLSYFFRFSQHPHTQKEYQNKCSFVLLWSKQSAMLHLMGTSETDETRTETSQHLKRQRGLRIYIFSSRIAGRISRTCIMISRMKGLSGKIQIIPVIVLYKVCFLFIFDLVLFQCSKTKILHKRAVIKVT